jgi:hypothetical protein
MCTVKWSGCLSVITEGFKDRVHAHVLVHKQFTVDELHEVLPYVCDLPSMRL